MLEIVISGGWVMVPIILCSIVAAAIILERLWTLQPRRVVPRNLSRQVWEWISNNQLNHQRIEELRRGSPLGQILAAGLASRQQDRSSLKEVIEDTGRHVVHELERYLNTLGTIAAISPLLGLLGTVTGMIRTFSALTANTAGDPSALAGGISEALITTAAGLMVAIPALIGYRYLRGRVDALVVQMEKDAIGLVAALQRKQYMEGLRAVQMRLRNSTARDEPDLNMTSLIDVVLLLLIFFMLTTTFVRPSRISIRLPEADVASTVSPEREELEISVTSSGEYRVNGRALVDSRPETLEAAIRTVMPDVEKRHLTLSADGRASHQAVVTAMDVAGRLGFVEVRITTTRAQQADQ